MERYRQLDAARRARVQCALAVSLLAGIWLLPRVCAQSKPNEAEIERLFQQQRWEEIAKLSPMLQVSPQIDLDYGIALARLGLWQRAETVLKDGLRMRPHDARFMVELAGVAFKQADYAKAQSWLERATRFSPHDEYNLDFLATVFYLEGNLEAALKYWNQVGKPHIDSVKIDPQPKTRLTLVDRAFTFSPASTLELLDLRTTEARLNQLDVFSNYRFDLQANVGGNFDLTLHDSERNGCGANTWMCLLSFFGETPAQTVNFQYFNIGGQALNVRSSFRWDAEKRRATAELDGPVVRQPKWHFQLGADWRNENWGLVNSFSGPATFLGALNLKREAASAQFTDAMSGRWQWSAQTEISNRQYHDILRGQVLDSSLLTSGFQLKQSLDVTTALLRWPERGLSVHSGASLSVIRLWSDDGRDYAKLQGWVRLHWLPQHIGRNYELQHTFRAGRTFGDPAFDELFMLGVLGDTDLEMKAHVATRDGKKGSAPLGRNYFLSNWDVTRNWSPLSLATIKVGPFVDTGKITDPIKGLGSHKWLWDVGMEAKVEVAGFSVVFSYGRDLRSGRNAFVASDP